MGRSGQYGLRKTLPSRNQRPRTLYLPFTSFPFPAGPDLEAKFRFGNERATAIKEVNLDDTIILGVLEGIRSNRY